MNSPDPVKFSIKPPGGVKRRAVTASPEASIVQGQADHLPTTLSSDRTKIDEGWREMLHAIGTIKRLQRQAPPLQPVSRERDLPLSFAQQRLWFLHQLEPDSPAYNSARAYRVTGPLNVAALAQSLDEIVRRHEILRTTFATIEGRPVQVIAPAMTLRHSPGSPHQLSTLPVIDLGHLPAPEREPEAMRLLTREIQQPFNLAQGPLLRVTLLRLGQEEHALLLVTPHILFAGQAWGGFNQELSALYQAFAAAKPSPLPELPIQYADFAAWQREWLRGEVLETLFSYWKEQLAEGFSPLALPTDRPRPAVETFRGASQSLTLSKTLSEALKTLSQQEGVTLFTTLLAAFQTLLHRYTAQEDVLVFSSAVGRNRIEIRELIGLFTNLFPLRTDFSGDPSFRELLGRARQVVLGAYAHQDLPFEQLMEVLQFERGPDHTSPFQVMFIFHNAPSPPLELSGLTVSPLQVDTGTTKFDLSLLMADTERGLSGTLTYKTDLFDAATITRMLEHFQTLLEGIVATAESPDQRLSDLPCLTEAERRHLFARRDDSQVDYAKVGDRILSTLDQVRSEPGKTFVAPRDNLELQLAGIWEDVLGIRPIGVRDNFFDLGGHSLLLARLFARTEKVFDKNLSPMTFFLAPTIEQLARMLREEEPSVLWFSQVKPQPGGAKRVKDTWWTGLKNRCLQAIALYAPGAQTMRVWLHRMRGVKIGHNVFIGTAVIIEPAFPQLVSIGDNVAISVRSVIIAHFGGTAEKARYNDEPSVRIEDNVFIGPGVIVLPNVTIGRGAVVAAGSVVNSSIPPHTMVQGNPAEPIAHCGIPLTGNSYGQFVRNLRPIQE